MARVELLEERLTHSVIGAFFEVYNTLGFGFLEHVYVLALERELAARGHQLAREVSVAVNYKGYPLGAQRIDMIVESRLLVETKSTYDLHKAAKRQLYNYLKSTNLEVGLLLHFGPEPRFYRMICRNTDLAGRQSHPERQLQKNPGAAITSHAANENDPPN
jgi:GxxExxY protein